MFNHRDPRNESDYNYFVRCVQDTTMRRYDM